MTQNTEINQSTYKMKITYNNIDIIHFNGKHYPIKHVNVNGDIKTIATDMLLNDLLDEKDDFVSKEASLIDDQIYCYLNSEEFYDDKNILLYIKDYME